jgi:hypothetical protein
MRVIHSSKMCARRRGMLRVSGRGAAEKSLIYAKELAEELNFL